MTPTTLSYWAMRLVISGVLVWFVYHPLMRLPHWLAGMILKRFPPERLSYLELYRTLMIPLWGLSLVVVYTVLSHFGATPLGSLFTTGFRVEYIVQGALLGLGQGAVTLSLAPYLLRAVAPLRARQVGNEVALENQILGQSGWMRTYADALQVVPMPFRYVLVATGPLGEELILRAFAIPLLWDPSPSAAVVASTLLFAYGQLGHLPSWYLGCAPALGAVIIGLSSGFFYVHCFPNIVPVFIAHVTFLAFLVPPGGFRPQLVSTIVSPVGRS